MTMPRATLVCATAGALAVICAGCLADATLPDDVGERTPCKENNDCPSGYTCPGVEGTGLARCLPTGRAACGNAVRDGEEQCDDGNWIDGDGCRADCSEERCGDGRIDATEACDDAGASATCSATCTRVVCGDGVVTAPEVCDDGDTEGGDGCSADCLRVEACGNDVIDTGEACDNGNQVGGDGCSADCRKVEVCGDAFLDEGEQCDDGNDNPSDACHQCGRTTWTARVVTGPGAGGSDPLSIPLIYPSAAYDRAGRVVASDGITHLFRIDELPPVGALGDRVVPLVGTGTYGYGGDGEPAVGASIDSPFGFDVDDAGRIFVADTSNARVRLVDTDGVIHTLAGTGVAGASGDGGLAVLAQVENPVDVALDQDGDLYVAELDGCRVRKIVGAADARTAIITTVAGSDCDALEPLTPSGLDVDDAGDLWIADSVRAVVWRLPRGQVAVDATDLVLAVGIRDTPAPTFPGPTPNVPLGRPSDVAVDGARVFIADSMHHQIYLVENDELSVFAGTGERGFAGDEGQAVSALFAGPRRVRARDGGVLVGDTLNRRLREIDSSGFIHTIAGAPPTPRPAAAWGEAVAVDASGAAYMADMIQAALWKVGVDGSLSVLAGTGSSGYDGEGFAATTSRISFISSLAFDASGALLLAEPNNRRLRRIAADGTLSTLAGNGDDGDAPDATPALGAALGAVSQVAVDPTTGLVWFVALPYPKIRRIDADGSLATPVGSNDEGDAGDGGSGVDARLHVPTSLAFTDDGVLLFADSENRRVRSYHPVLDVVDTVAGTGATGYNGDGIDAVLANLDDPRKITVDVGGGILIADWSQHRVRRVGSDGVITSVIGDGAASLFGDGGPADNARVVEPRGIAADRSPGAGASDLVLTDVDADRGVLRRVRQGVIDSVNPLFADGVGALDAGALARPGALSSLAPTASDVVLCAAGNSGLIERARFDDAEPGGGALDIVVGRPDGFVLDASANEDGDPLALAGEARARYLDRFGDACGLAFDGVDSVYVADRARGVIARVRLVDVDDAGSWTVALIAGESGDRRHVDGDAGSGRLVGPCGLALDASSSTLFIADADDATVRRLDLLSGAVDTLFGVAGLAGGDDDLLDAPMGLALDAEGLLFVADTGNHRVRRVTMNGDADDILGTGEAASSGDGAPARAFPVQSPRGLAFDAFGNLLVSSTRAVRLVSANEDGVVDGTGAVLTIYGAPPRDGFPADSTYCLAGLDTPSDGVVRVVDACQGYLLELTRAP